VSTTGHLQSLIDWLLDVRCSRIAALCRCCALAEQLPLRRHFAPPAMTEPIQPMRTANVRKHRLHDPQPLTVTVTTDLAVDLTLHPGAVALGPTLRSTDEQRHLPLYRALRVT
jgi:hypothetical protein